MGNPTRPNIMPKLSNTQNYGEVCKLQNLQSMKRNNVKYSVLHLWTEKHTKLIIPNPYNLQRHITYLIIRINMTWRIPPTYYHRSPTISECQLSNGRFEGCGRFDDPEKFLFDVLNAMPLKFLRSHKQVIKTYSRLVTIPYPDLPFEEHKMEILQLATELTYAVSASSGTPRPNNLISTTL